MTVFDRVLQINVMGLEYPVSADQTDDRELVRRCQKGDHSAFNELFRRYRNQAYEYAYRVTRNPHDAEDIVQSAFIRAFKYIDRFDTTYPFYPWLKTIISNESNTHFTKASRRKSEPLESSDPENPGPISLLEDPNSPNPESDLYNKELRGIIDQAITHLPDQQRICFIRFEIDGEKIKDIAVQLGCTEGTIKTHLHRARHALRILLQDLMKTNPMAREL